MAVHIRLARAGTKKTPFYRIVVADQRSPRGGRFIERLGTYDPRRTEIRLNSARAHLWISKGAQPSHTVSLLLKRKDIVDTVAGPGSDLLGSVGGTPAAAPAAPAAAPAAAEAKKARGGKK
jgi:small subunit ribosomal protein S16